MTADVINLSTKQPPVRYSVHVEHYYDGSMTLCFEGISEVPTLRDKESLLTALKEAVAIVENEIARHKEQEDGQRST
jgi:hypothetical protein